MDLNLLNVPIQENVIDQNSVSLVHTETESTEFNTFGHALGKKSGLAFPGFSEELRHLVNVVLSFLLASDFTWF